MIQKCANTITIQQIRTTAMIFFVRHYLHRRKVHIRSVKTTNTLSHRRHQQGQRRASHQSVCPFFSFFLLLFLPTTTSSSPSFRGLFYFFLFLFSPFPLARGRYCLPSHRLTYFIVFLFLRFFSSSSFLFSLLPGSLPLSRCA